MRNTGRMLCVILPLTVRPPALCAPRLLIQSRAYSFLASLERQQRRLHKALQRPAAEIPQRFRATPEVSRPVLDGPLCDREEHYIRGLRYLSGLSRRGFDQGWAERNERLPSIGAVGRCARGKAQYQGLPRK